MACRRVGLTRPKDQVKPGNVIYIRVKDADRDLTDQPDKIDARHTFRRVAGMCQPIALTETPIITSVPNSSSYTVFGRALMT